MIFQDGDEIVYIAKLFKKKAIKQSLSLHARYLPKSIKLYTFFFLPALFESFFFFLYFPTKRKTIST